MGDEETVGEFKVQLAAQARIFEEKRSAIEVGRNNIDGLQEAPAGGD